MHEKQRKKEEAAAFFDYHALSSKHFLAIHNISEKGELRFVIINQHYLYAKIIYIMKRRRSNKHHPTKLVQFQCFLSFPVWKWVHYWVLSLISLMPFYTCLFFLKRPDACFMYVIFSGGHKMFNRCILYSCCFLVFDSFFAGSLHCEKILPWYYVPLKPLFSR